MKNLLAAAVGHCLAASEWLRRLRGLWRQGPSISTVFVRASIAALALAGVATATLHSRSVAADEIEIGLVTLIDGPFDESLGRSAEARAQELGIKLEDYPIHYSDEAGQAQAVQDLISRGVRGLAVVVGDNPAILGPPLEQAGYSGIPVVVLNRALRADDASLAKVTITPNSEAIGALMAAKIARLAPDGGTFCSYVWNGASSDPGLDAFKAAITSIPDGSGSGWRESPTTCSVDQSSTLEAQAVKFVDSSSSLNAFVVVSSTSQQAWIRKNFSSDVDQVRIAASPDFLGTQAVEALNKLIKGEDVDYAIIANLDVCTNNECVQVPNICSQPECKDKCDGDCKDCCP